VVDVPALRESFGRVAVHGDEVPLYFYSYLFLRNPHLRPLFPAGMAAQRDRLVGALIRIVSDVDRLDALVPYLSDLGRDHRKFDIVAEHYPQVGEALLATLAHFLDRDWTPHLAEQWTAAYGVVADVMVRAAEADEDRAPYQEAEIVAHDRRATDLAVLTVRPEGEVRYVPGQSLSVETARRPRTWRYLSPANAPRPDRTLEFHVRAVDGGWVSPSLVLAATVGDRLLLGPPVGELALDRSDDDVLMLAGGTGLAPLKAMIEHLAAGTARRRVRLYVEARTEADLYDLPALDRLAAAHPWLAVVPTALSGAVRRAEAGRAAEVALRHGRWGRHAVFVCGGPAMVAESRALLVRSGIDPHRVHHETFTYRAGPAGDATTVDGATDLARPSDALTGDLR